MPPVPSLCSRPFPSPSPFPPSTPAPSKLVEAGGPQPVCSEADTEYSMGVEAVEPFGRDDLITRAPQFAALVVPFHLVRVD